MKTKFSLNHRYAGTYQQSSAVGSAPRFSPEPGQNHVKHPLKGAPRPARPDRDPNALLSGKIRRTRTKSTPPQLPGPSAKVRSPGPTALLAHVERNRECDSRNLPAWREPLKNRHSREATPRGDLHGEAGRSARAKSKRNRASIASSRHSSRSAPRRGMRTRRYPGTPPDGAAQRDTHPKFRPDKSGNTGQDRDGQNRVYLTWLQSLGGDPTHVSPVRIFSPVRTILSASRLALYRPGPWDRPCASRVRGAPPGLPGNG